MKRRKRGEYLAATLGAALGGVVMGVAGAQIGLGFGQAHIEPGSVISEIYLTAFGLTVGFFSGVWLGAVLGCWLGLRLFGYAGAGATSAALGCLLPLGFVVSLFAAATIFVSLLQRVIEHESWVGITLLLLVPLLPLPVTARALAKRVAARRTTLP